MKKLIKFTVTVILAAAIILPAGCTKSGNTSTTFTPSETDRWLEMLGTIPSDIDIKNTSRIMPADVEITYAVYIQDHAYLAEKQKKYPDVAEVPERTQPMQNSPFWNIIYYNDEEWQRLLGFVKSEMDREIFSPLVGSPRLYRAFLGRFNREDIDSALKADPMNDDLEVVNYAGVEYYSSGKDGMNLDRRSNIHRLGEATRLAVVNDFVFSVSFTVIMEEMIDAYKDNVPSLADLENYQLLAAGMTELDAFTALFSSESQAQSHITEIHKDIIENPGQDEGSAARRIMAEQLQREVQLKPYQAYAVGAGLDDKGYYMTIVMVNADEKTAKENVTALKEQIKHSKTSLGTVNTTTGTPWPDIIDSMEVNSRGRLTLAKLYGAAAFYWKAFDLGSMYEPLLMYKG